MIINLPDIDIKPEWTIPGQLKKLLDRLGEEK